MTFRAHLIEITPYDALASEFKPFADAAARFRGMDLEGNETVAIFEVEGTLSIQAAVLDGLSGPSGLEHVLGYLEGIQLELGQDDIERLKEKLKA